MERSLMPIHATGSRRGCQLYLLCNSRLRASLPTRNRVVFRWESRAQQADLEAVAHVLGKAQGRHDREDRAGTDEEPLARAEVEAQPSVEHADRGEREGAH